MPHINRGKWNGIDEHGNIVRAVQSPPIVRHPTQTRFLRPNGESPFVHDHPVPAKLRPQSYGDRRTAMPERAGFDGILWRSTNHVWSIRLQTNVRMWDVDRQQWSTAIGELFTVVKGDPDAPIQRFTVEWRPDIGGPTIRYRSAAGDATPPKYVHTAMLDILTRADAAAANVVQKQRSMFGHVARANLDRSED